MKHTFFQRTDSTWKNPSIAGYIGYNFSTIPAITTPAWSNTIGDAYVGYKDGESPTPWSLNSTDIICAQNGTPGLSTASIKAGETITFHWSPWPIGHHGPVMTYMANCNGSCTSVDKTKLQFFKIAESGLLNKTRLGSPVPDYPSTGSGFWAADILSYNGTSEARIPDVRKAKSLAPGNYVVRHETMALQHIFLGEVQAYPFCFNFVVTGKGTAHPKGVLGTQLYHRNESAFYYDVYGPMNSSMPDFQIPGPPVWRFPGGPLSCEEHQLVSAFGLAISNALFLNKLISPAITGSKSIPFGDLSKNKPDIPKPREGYQTIACLIYKNSPEFKVMTKSPVSNKYGLRHFPRDQSYTKFVESKRSVMIGSGTMCSLEAHTTDYYQPLKWGYHMDDENFGGASDRKCQMSFLSTTSVLNYIYPRSVSGANSWTSTDASNPKDLSTTTVDISYNIYGDGIPILWQSTDLAIFAAATASTTPTISPIISQSSSTSTQQTSTSSTLPNSPTITPISDGLSSGSKIGIGIGIPLAVIAIGLVAFFIYIRRRRRDVASRAIGNELQETQACKGLIPELPNTSGIHEMQAPVHEMYSDNDTIPRIKSQHEVPGQYELAIQDEHSSTHELSSQHELSGQEETPGQHD
ncbi:hypothetical protein G7Y89_g6106 [Cudoniella acicularis]|uniref:Auxiliary Activity family 9 catalytic domain-containing protein n=1 Tax=Cudoniella acicularis TaxID=354080 RepID=A0A8H4RL47_9HELO|nr:hypothetical protein G7Y89_g6106 [Cudoniella acicularis]